MLLVYGPKFDKLYYNLSRCYKVYLLSQKLLPIMSGEGDKKKIELWTKRPSAEIVGDKLKSGVSIQPGDLVDIPSKKIEHGVLISIIREVFDKENKFKVFHNNSIFEVSDDDLVLSKLDKSKETKLCRYYGVPQGRYFKAQYEIVRGIFRSYCNPIDLSIKHMFPTDEKKDMEAFWKTLSDTKQEVEVMLVSETDKNSCLIANYTVVKYTVD